MVKRALIFGANGFVGAYLTQELVKNGYEVYGSDLSESAKHEGLFRYYTADVNNAAMVKSVFSKVKPNTVFNLAAVSSVGFSWKKPQHTVSVNVNGTISILEAAASLSVLPKVLLVGSSEEYAPSVAPLKESDPIDATNPYGISKVAQERFAKAYSKKYGLRVYMTRSFNHTGVGQTEAFVLPSWCAQVAKIEASGRPGALMVGNVDVWRDFSDVRDVVRAYRMLIESDCYDDVFNIGSGRTYLLRDLANLIASFSSQHISVEADLLLTRPTDNIVISCDASKARQQIGWKTTISLEETLKEMYESFLSKCSSVDVY